MQTNRPKLIVAASLIVFFTLLLLLMVNRILDYIEPRVMEYPTAGPSKIALLDAISRHKNGEISNVDLSSVTTFPWDRLYVFESYTQPSEIAEVVGRSWRKSCYTTIHTSEGLALLVFTNSGQVVDCIEIPRNIADFAPLWEYEMGFSREEAQFIIDSRERIIWAGNR
jgi:hypothetical protein